MNATIQKQGNSQGIRIPKIVLEQANLSENDQVELTTLYDNIILKKITNTRHIALQERLETFYGKTLNMIEKIENYEEIETGEPVGDEICQLF